MRSVFFIIALLITSNLVFGQTDSKILVIRKTVQAINNDSGYKVKTLDNDYFANEKGEITDNGQSLTGYYKGVHLKKVIYSLGLSYCMKTYEYYFSDSGLVFVFEKEEDYSEKKDKSGEFVGLELFPAFEGRYYFEKNKIFQKKIKGHKRMSNGNNDNNLLDNMNDLMSDLKKAKSK